MTNQRIVTDGESRYGLSDEQYEAVIGTKDIFLKACPGSGKTRSVAGRVAWLESNNSKVALISFTRTGADEIGNAVIRDHKINLSSASFVGTVQSFLQRYVLTPFGHLVTNSTTGVRIDPEQVNTLDPQDLNSADYQFGIDGSLKGKNSRTSNSLKTLQRVREIKIENAKNGYVGLEDDVYWSYQVLKSRPDVARALGIRFDEIIVDEAQDLSKLQIECLRLIRDGGLQSIVLVGDYDQTIYEWRDSNPALCESFATDIKLTSKVLSENYRSSQVICNLSAKFRPNKWPDTAVGEHKDVNAHQMLFTYRADTLKHFPSKLDQLIEYAGLNVVTKAILTRTWATANEISGVVRPTATGDVKVLLSAKLAGDEIVLDLYRDIERSLLRRAFGGRLPSSEINRLMVRNEAIALVDQLPDLTGDLWTWAVEANKMLNERARAFSSTTFEPKEVNPAFVNRPDALVSAFQLPRPESMRAATIHDAKGESIDAVMLVAGIPSWSQAQGGFDDATKWSAPLRGDWTGSAEDVRVAYVALTRARQLAVVALPESTSPSIVQCYVKAGFVHMEFGQS